MRKSARARKEIHTSDRGFRLESGEATMPLYDFDHSAMQIDEIARAADVTRTATDYECMVRGHPTALPIAEWHALNDDYDRYCAAANRDHGRWMQDRGWMTLYQVRPRHLQLVVGTAIRMSTARQMSVPCHYCGIILPTKTIMQADHHHPKGARPDGTGTTGGTRAVAKVLRAFNATFLVGGGADGAKGISFRHPVPIPPQAPGHVAPISAMRRAKYTLTDKGILAMSMLIRSKGSVDEVTERCLNSFLNIVPLCAACNGSGAKGAAARFIAP